MLNRVMNVEIGFKAIGAAVAIGELKELAGAFMSLSDTATRIQARLATSTDNQAQAAYAMRQVRDIAMDTRAPLDAIATLYSRLEMRANTLGVSQNQVGKITENFSKALKVQGVSMAEADSALRQFSQAMQKGKLNGDEFNSMAENAPIILDILASSIAKIDHGPKFEKVRASLKQMGTEGKVTAQTLAKALDDDMNPALQKLQEKFDKIPITFEDMGTIAKNTATEMAGALTEGLDIQGALNGLRHTSSDAFQSMLDSVRGLGRDIKVLFATAFGNAGDSMKDFTSIVKEQVQGLRNLFRDLAIDIAKVQDLLGKAGNMNNSVLAWRRQHGIPELTPDGFKQVPYDPKDFTGYTTNNEDQVRQAFKDSDLKGIMDDGWRRFWEEQGRSHGNDHGPGFDLSGGGKSNASKAEKAYDRFVAELTKMGIHINSGERSYSEQLRLYRTLPKGQAAPPGMSDHNRWQGIDVGSNVPMSKIEEAAARAGVKIDRTMVHEGTGLHRHIGFSEGGNGKSWEETQADRAKKYSDELKKLNESIAEVGMSKRDLAALDALEAAGLERNINATDAQSKSIIENARTLEDKKETLKFLTEGQKELTEEEHKTAQAQAEASKATMGQYQAEIAAIDDDTQKRIAEVESKREWITATQQEKDLRDAIIAQIKKQGEIQKQAAADKRAKDFGNDMLGLRRQGEDTSLDMLGVLGKMNPEDLALKKQLLEVERQRQDAIRDFADKYGEGSVEFLQAVEEVNANSQAQMELLNKTAQMEKFRGYVGELQQLFTGMFTDARQTMKQFFTELITKLLTAIAYAIIFKTNMASGLQMSGGGGGLVGGILSTFLTSLAGGMAGGIHIGGAAPAASTVPLGPPIHFAANGGTLKQGTLYGINEKGQEMFMPGVDGRMITNKQLMSAMGQTNLSLGQTVITVNNNGGQMDEQKLAIHVAAKQERAMRNLIREELSKR